MNKILKGSVVFIYVFFFAWTIFLVFGMQQILNVHRSKVFPLENAGFFIIGICVIALLFFVNSRYGKQIESCLQNKYRLILLISLLSLLVWQIYTCYGGYFKSGWDPETINAAVSKQISYDYDHLNNFYFSWFPNNMLLVWVFKAVARFAILIGYTNWEFSLVIFQCLIDVVSIWLVYKVTFDFTKNQRVAFLAYAIAFLFVGISPWFIVAYSDATGFLFPILIVRLFQLIRKSNKRAVKVILCISLGFVSIAGFYLKPQVFIAFIAVVLFEICCLFGKGFKRLLPGFIIRIMCYTFGIIVFFASYNSIVIPSLHFQRNPNTIIGWQHYLMMGLNTSTDGIWCADDYAFTQKYSTNEERNEADFQEAKRRIKELGIGGMIQHLSRKQLVNYGDGTFAWAVEGNSFAGDPDWAHNGISEFIRSFIKPDGEKYNWFISLKQLIWVMILFFQLFVFAYRSRSLSDGDNSIIIMALSIIGLTIFELLFEARARYLFCYTPLFVILGCWGLRNVYCLIHNHFRNPGILKSVA